MSGTFLNRDTFQEYLERGEAKGVSDFSIRIVRNPDGLLDFYIHPDSKDGETADFHVSAGFVNRLDGCAGSARELGKPLLGSATTKEGGNG